MTQYRLKRPSTESTDSTDLQSAKDLNILEHDLKKLSERVQQQDDEIRELRRVVKKLQNETRLAVNAFNLKNHG